MGTDCAVRLQAAVGDALAHIRPPAVTKSVQAPYARQADRTGQRLPSVEDLLFALPDRALGGAREVHPTGRVCLVLCEEMDSGLLRGLGTLLRFPRI